MHRGSCLCGKICYEYRGEIDEVSMYHCRQCRKAQGTAFAVAPIRSAGFRITQGAQYLKEFRATPSKARVFCSECGSPLYSARDDRPEAKRLRLGTLDTPISPSKCYHAWVSTQAEWFEITDGLPKFPEFAR
ncbi:GFA family protein [Halomonas sp. McH1-25]|uniref:GFA family protein n=1 Tax=unclassified Halomonas TaxID=2609666 RepID=UPI001EF627D4|nr:MULTISPECIES: GFA family protein [unclassified Halomonas]MCG7599312.1 GFA family protein [Halomonas sp. McH1-25]MCP1341180.1 GFA family protein [Halomonas sp. FL8]MCP1362086.1 GFA family protein [Halomonas sp. BBD45]MCP1366122.1 GFA family protein [Halomonas sp. BBD48]